MYFGLMIHTYMYMCMLLVLYINKIVYNYIYSVHTCILYSLYPQFDGTYVVSTIYITYTRTYIFIHVHIILLLYTLHSVQFDGTYVVSGAYDFLVKVWDPIEGTCQHTLQGHTNRVYSLLVRYTFDKSFVNNNRYNCYIYMAAFVAQLLRTFVRSAERRRFTT